MQRLFEWATSLNHRECVCPLCHVGTVVVCEDENDYEDEIVKACTECGHK